MHWLDINAQGNLVSELRHWFNALWESGEFIAGLRKNLFLYIDREALQSRDDEVIFLALGAGRGGRTTEDGYQAYYPYSVCATHPTGFITSRDQMAPVSIHVKIEHASSSCLSLAQ